MALLTPFTALLVSLCLPMVIAAQNIQSPVSVTPPVQHLTLDKAEEIAIQHHPQLKQARFTAAAAGELPTQLRAAYYPMVTGNFTGVEADPGSRITAGALNNPIIYDRYANGLELNQLVTDFGRTHNLVASAHLQAEAAQAAVEVTREDVLLGVDSAYFGVLRSLAVLKVAEQTTNERQVVVNQVTALTNNRLKSGLDLSFAQVNLSQAQLLLTSAQNDVESSYADLAMALGYSDHQSFDLADETAANLGLPTVDEAVAKALANRPELAQQQYNVEAAKRFVTAERDLYFPRLEILGVAGLTPYGQDQLLDRYAAAGFNLEVPIFEGHLFGARRAEANFRAQSQDQQLQVLKDSLVRDVRHAWLNANTVRQNLDLTAQLVAQADKALNLAQERYKLGLSSIVELSEAQLNDAQAQIQAVTAKYNYRAAIAQLQYQEGNLK
jgi:outer membrane protein